MRRHLIPALVLALALPSAAAAKGPLAATVAGPGLDRPVRLTGGGHPGSAGTLGRVAEHAGFFQAAFGGYATKPSSERPRGDLGPRYVVTYAMGTRDEVIRQDLYPYAEPDPVSYTAPGQRFYETMETLGGWLVSGPELKAVLVEAGLPPAAPGGGSGGWSPIDGPWWPLGAALALALSLALGLAAFRRRPAALARS